ncbi:MAG TPA: cysteine-rich CWC family protein [Pyrinomonadaceae bacterium]|nr:cysteine-rich CWC family protein [Pyrinomonadaceae bacterium]
MITRELPQLVTEETCAQSVCERCGEPFGCGAQSSACWCAEVKLTDEAREALREKYKSCLCRACLEQFAIDQL